MHKDEWRNLRSQLIPVLYGGGEMGTNNVKFSAVLRLLGVMADYLYGLGTNNNESRSFFFFFFLGGGGVIS